MLHPTVKLNLLKKLNNSSLLSSQKLHSSLLNFQVLILVPLKSPFCVPVFCCVVSCTALLTTKYENSVLRWNCYVSLIAETLLFSLSRSNVIANSIQTNLAEKKKKKKGLRGLPRVVSEPTSAALNPTGKTRPNLQLWVALRLAFFSTVLFI